MHVAQLPASRPCRDKYLQRMREVCLKNLFFRVTGSRQVATHRASAEEVAAPKAAKLASACSVRRPRPGLSPRSQEGVSQRRDSKRGDDEEFLAPAAFPRTHPCSAALLLPAGVSGALRKLSRGAGAGSQARIRTKATRPRSPASSGTSEGPRWRRAFPCRCKRLAHPLWDLCGRTGHAPNRKACRRWGQFAAELCTKV